MVHLYHTRQVCMAKCRQMWIYVDAYIYMYVCMFYRHISIENLKVWASRGRHTHIHWSRSLSHVCACVSVGCFAGELDDLKKLFIVLWVYMFCRFVLLLFFFIWGWLVKGKCKQSLKYDKTTLHTYMQACMYKNVCVYVCVASAISRSNTDTITNTHTHTNTYMNNVLYK